MDDPKRGEGGGDELHKFFWWGMEGTPHENTLFLLFCFFYWGVPTYWLRNVRGQTYDGKNLGCGGVDIRPW